MSQPYAGVVVHYNGLITVARRGRPSRTYRASRASRARVETLAYRLGAQWAPCFHQQHEWAGYKAPFFKEE